MEADIKPDTKTRKRMENVAADRVMSGDSSSAQVDPDPMCLTSFGDDSTGPPALPCSRDDILVDKGAAVPKPCLSLMDMRTLTAAGGLLPADIASTAMRTIFPRPFFLGSLEKPRNVPAGQTTSLPPFVDGGLFKRNQRKLWCSILAVLQVVCAPARFCEGEARCFAGTFSFGRRIVPEAGAFFGTKWKSGTSYSERGTSDSFTPYVLRLFLFLRSQAGLNKSSKSDGTRLYELWG